VSIVIVSGALANKLDNGGAAWTRLSWALGFKALGFEVAFVEQIRPEVCGDTQGEPAALENSANLAYFDRVTEQFGLSERSALVCEGGGLSHGLTRTELADLARSADLLVNISGHLTIPAVKDRVRHKVYVDLDPGYTQFWHASGTVGPRLEGHDFYYTVGANIGRPDCPIPIGGLTWRPVRQPVVLDQWPPTATSDRDRFTTVASWRGPYGPVAFGSKTYGLKVHEFRKFLELPGRIPQTVEIALEIQPADARDKEALERHGWRVVDSKAVASDPVGFRQYVQGSGAEFSTAQGIYVETESGWFSDRTVRYLASGKPALVQDTGFSHSLPVGEGLLAFRTLDEVVAGARSIAQDYERHCHAARALAELFFESSRVLGRVSEEVGVTP
jgi:hypothetical protein